MKEKKINSKCDDNDYYRVIEWQIIIKMRFFSAKALPLFICSIFFTSCCFKNEKKGEGMKSFMQKFITMIFPLSLEAWLNLLFITTHNIIRFSHIQKVIYTYSFFFSSSASFLLRIGAEKKHKTKKERKKWQFTVLSWLRHISNNVYMCDCKCIHYT